MQDFIIEQGSHTFSIDDIVAISDVAFGTLGAGNYAVYLKAGMTTPESTAKQYIVIADATYSQATLVKLFKNYKLMVLQKLQDQ